MKKLILFLSIIFIAIEGFAQGRPSNYSATTPNYVALTPWGTFGTFYYEYGQGADSVHLSQTTGDTIPSGYMIYTQEINLAAAIKYTGQIVLPANPSIGQQVEISSNKAFYHLFTTKPAFMIVDTNGGGYYVQLVWSGKFWKMVN